MPTTTDPFVKYLADLEAAHLLGNDTEHTHRPALKLLLEKLSLGVTATNEPKRVQVGAPDYIITRPTGHGPQTLGYVEAKDIDAGLEGIERDSNRAEPTTREGAQLKRYKGGLSNLLFTDYLEFRWYTNGARRQIARLATVGAGKKLVRDKEGAAAVRSLLDNYLNHQPEPITRPQELALRMARLTHIIRDIIIEAFQQDKATPLLKGWRTAFAQVLITDLDQPLPERVAEFADMFAQTLAYGLFSARVMDITPESFTRQEAQYLIPPTNPFLRRFFYEISGPDLDSEPYGPFVNDLAALLEQTDMDAVLADFGKRTRQEDPVVHFYETFLAAYDPKLREARGVYYTPYPVVSYIVRSVDYLLKTRFGCAEGLADSAKVKVANTDPSLTVKGTNEPRKTRESHRVLILDPAVGTGTFLYSVVDHIRAQFMQQGNAGIWSDYVREHLLPRLFGFELLMAPYAVAHFKLGLQLAGRDLPEDMRAAWAYDFASGERLGVYLTNTLEGPHEYTGLPLFTQFLADETSAANSIKRDLPIMVVMGNPPYSATSSNKGDWITDLVRRAYYPNDQMREQNPKLLLDDYVKFIRFAQWRIERTGAGILAFISNHGYLDNATFRRMRKSLMETFTDIYILNLHGNINKKERSPDGSPDENVFDIQQGVAIGIFVKQMNKQGPAQVYHADLWGVRESKDKNGGKYHTLLETDVADTSWYELAPQAPFYLFVPQNVDLRSEYEVSWKVTDIFPTNSSGMNTLHDALVISFDKEQLVTMLRDATNPAISNDEFRTRYQVIDSRDWKLETCRDRIGSDDLELLQDRISKCLYRPFDTRWIVLDNNFVTYPRWETTAHFLKSDSLGFATARQALETISCFPSRIPMGQHKIVDPYNRSYIFPLYLYPDSKQAAFDTGEAGGKGGRRPNLNPAFIEDVSARLGLSFIPDGKGDLTSTFGPEDVFHYMYAVFHSPTYRARYAEFLKMDFPRLPLTSDVQLFRNLCAVGEQLVGLHLMEEQAPPIASYPIPGDNAVEKVSYTGPGQGAEKGRVWINKTQYFEGVPPAVWEFHIGGYQVADKWLKDRKGRKLTYEDLTHYMRVVSALAETMRLMQAIDEAIPEWPIQ